MPKYWMNTNRVPEDGAPAKKRDSRTCHIGALPANAGAFWRTWVNAER